MIGEFPGLEQTSTRTTTCATPRTSARSTARCSSSGSTTTPDALIPGAGRLRPPDADRLSRVRRLASRGRGGGGPRRRRAPAAARAPTGLGATAHDDDDMLECDALTLSRHEGATRAAEIEFLNAGEDAARPLGQAPGRGRAPPATIGAARQRARATSSSCGCEGLALRAVVLAVDDHRELGMEADAARSASASDRGRSAVAQALEHAERARCGR